MADAADPSRDRLPVTTFDPVPRWSPMRWVLGLLSLALHSGGELTRLVGQMHHTWEQLPRPLDLPSFGAPAMPVDPTAMPKIYLLIRLMLERSADLLQQWTPQLPTPHAPPLSLRRLHSAMNGVFGDKLQVWEHPLAQAMELVDQQGQPLALTALQQRGNAVVLFIHGLCLSEYDWQTAPHRQFANSLQARGHSVAWLRYNTGLPIYDNGQRLHCLLTEQWQQQTGKPLILVGHSMGGLVIRSALHLAGQQGKAGWQQDLTHAAYLASPHDGSPLERIGNFANSLLGVSPYSRPLMALGNIRSLGIRSLRHGRIEAPADDSGRQYPVPFNEQVRHLLLAAQMEADPARRWLGDGLVPVSSALSEAHFPRLHAQVERVLLDGVGHLRLLEDERTWDVLGRWLGPMPQP